MHRQIYPVLFASGLIVATAVCLRPQMTEELLAIARAETGYVTNPLRSSPAATSRFAPIEGDYSHAPGDPYVAEAPYGAGGQSAKWRQPWSPVEPSGPAGTGSAQTAGVGYPYSPQEAPDYRRHSAAQYVPQQNGYARPTGAATEKSNPSGVAGNGRYGANVLPPVQASAQEQLPPYAPASPGLDPRVQYQPTPPYHHAQGARPPADHYGAPAAGFASPAGPTGGSTDAYRAASNDAPPGAPQRQAAEMMPFAGQYGGSSMDRSADRYRAASETNPPAGHTGGISTSIPTGPAQMGTNNPTPTHLSAARRTPDNAASRSSGQSPAAAGYDTSVYPGPSYATPQAPAQPTNGWGRSAAPSAGPTRTDATRPAYRPDPPPSVASADPAPRYRPAGAPQAPPVRGSDRVADLRSNANAPRAVPARREPAAQPCASAQILARVGSDVILASEVLPSVNDTIRRNSERIPEGQEDLFRQRLIRQRLKALIETKLIYQDALRSIPEEGLPHIKKQLEEEFEKAEIHNMMERAGAGSRQELEAKLAALGTSIQREKKSFSERILAAQWMRQQIDHDQEITHAQMLAYYEEHAEEFETPARARWQELAVHFSEFPSRAAARQALAQMGNQIIDGTDFAEVAKAHSDGPTASSGGNRDWTTKGSLRNQKLDKALFSLPIGRLSPILEDERGLMIVRVVQREEVRRKPFVEAQVEIREKIREDRVRKQQEAYAEKLRDQIPVWTIFDEPGADIEIEG